MKIVNNLPKKVDMNNLQIDFKSASQVENLVSGESVSTLFGKTAKAISSLITHLGDAIVHITADERTTWNKNTTDITALNSALSWQLLQVGTSVTLTQDMLNGKHEVKFLLSNTEEIYGEITFADIALDKTRRITVSGYYSGQNDNAKFQIYQVGTLFACSADTYTCCVNGTWVEAVISLYVR